jgi:YHS domain-containing protein
MRTVVHTMTAVICEAGAHFGAHPTQLRIAANIAPTRSPRRPPTITAYATLKEIVMKRFAYVVLATAALTLAACAPLITQNAGGKFSPVNAHAIDGNDRVLMKGADVVSYFTQGKDMQGNPSIKSSYENVTFYFASAENKALFDKEPAKYLPQYGGYCANGIVYGIPWGGDADAWRMIEGKLYIFGGAGSRDAFLLDVPKNRALADKYWAEEVSGSNAFIQRTKRTTVARVAHYKSGSELALEVAAAKK